MHTCTCRSCFEERNLGNKYLEPTIHAHSGARLTDEVVQDIKSEMRHNGHYKQVHILALGDNNLRAAAHRSEMNKVLFWTFIAYSNYYVVHVLRTNDMRLISTMKTTTFLIQELEMQTEVNILAERLDDVLKFAQTFQGDITVYVCSPIPSPATSDVTRRHERDLNGAINRTLRRNHRCSLYLNITYG